MSLDVPCGWRCRARRAHSSETSFDKPASRRDAMSNIFLRCIYVLVARSKHVSIHTFMVHRGGPAVCSLGALGGLRFLPEPPRGFGISVLHRRVRTIVCVRLAVDENKSYPSWGRDLLQVSLQRKGSSVGR